MIYIHVPRSRRHAARRQLEDWALDFEEYRYWSVSVFTIRTGCPELYQRLQAWFTEFSTTGTA